jgi:MFS family permease
LGLSSQIKEKLKPALPLLDQIFRWGDAKLARTRLFSDYSLLDGEMNKSPAVTPSTVATPQSHNMTTGLFIMGTFLFWTSLYLYVPTLPAYVQTKTDNLALVGTILSMYGLWQAIVRLPLGIVADWVGHRKLFIVGGLLLSALGAVLMASAKSPTDLLIGRSVTGLAAATWATFVVAFSGYFTVGETIRATALLNFINSSGRILATSSTGLITSLGGYLLPFYLAAGVAVSGVMFMAPTREPAYPHARLSFKTIASVISRRDVLTPSLLAALSQYITWATTYSFTPVLAKQLGATSVLQSALLAGHLLAVTVGNLSAIYIIRRTGIHHLMLAACSMLVAGVGFTAISTSLPVLFLVQCLIGLAIGLNLPTLMGLSIRNVDQSERNTAMGLHQSVYAAGMFGGPWLSGFLASLIGLRWMLGATALASAVIGLPIIIELGRIYTAEPS